MAYDVKFAVTQPYHGPAGALLHDVGDLLDPAKVPDAAAGHMTVVEAAPPKRASAKAAPEPPAAETGTEPGD